MSDEICYKMQEKCHISSTTVRAACSDWYLCLLLSWYCELVGWTAGSNKNWTFIHEAAVTCEARGQQWVMLLWWTVIYDSHTTNVSNKYGWVKIKVLPPCYRKVLKYMTEVNVLSYFLPVVTVRCCLLHPVEASRPDAAENLLISIIRISVSMLHNSDDTIDSFSHTIDPHAKTSSDQSVNDIWECEEVVWRARHSVLDVSHAKEMNWLEDGLLWEDQGERLISLSDRLD